MGVSDVWLFNKNLFCCSKTYICNEVFNLVKKLGVFHSIRGKYIPALDLPLEEQCEFQGFSTAAPSLSEPPLNTEFLLWKSSGAKSSIQMIHLQPHSLPEEESRVDLKHIFHNLEKFCVSRSEAVKTKE